MSLLGDIFSKIEEVTPGIEWAAFFFCGAGDSLGGFRELETCINGDVARRGGAKENAYDFPCGTALENILNSPANQAAILEAVVPQDLPLRCVDQGSCEGVLLLVCRRPATLTEVAIPLDWRPSEDETNWIFDVPAGFRGIMVNYESTDKLKNSAVLS
jgi:hypothetical protein